MRSPEAGTATCSECGGALPAIRQKGRPFKTCGPECFTIRNVRRNREKREAMKPRAFCSDCSTEIEYEQRRRQRCDGCALQHRRKLAAEREARRRASGVERVRPPQPSKPDARTRLDTRLRSMYGLTLAECEAMAEAQGGRCACCGNLPDGRGKGGTLVVDHCHDRGHVRGLLCGNCNTAMGLLGDDPEVAERAAAYLRRTSGVIVVG